MQFSKPGCSNYSSLFSSFLLKYINCAVGLHWDVCTHPHDALRSYSHTDSTVMSAHVRVMYFARTHTHFHSHIESPISPSLPCTYLCLFSFTFFSSMTFTDKGKYRIVEHITWSTPLPTISCKKWCNYVLYELMKLYHVHTLSTHLWCTWIWILYFGSFSWRAIRSGA